MTKGPIAVDALSVPARAKASNYPEPYASQMLKRFKHPLGEAFGLKNFGVNLTRILPGGSSALRHAHSTQDELIYVLEGEPVLITDEGETPLKPGMCAGFPANGRAHALVNRTNREVIYLEVGDRSAGDRVTYPDDDIMAIESADGVSRVFRKKDGSEF